MNTMPMGRIEMALRERLEMAGCHIVREDETSGGQVWFSPHMNREFLIPYPVVSADGANKVLRAAGMEAAFRDGQEGNPRP